MSYFLAMRAKRPNAAQMARICKLVRDVSDELFIQVSQKGSNEQPFYIEAPDYWGASHMQEQCAKVQEIVTSTLGPPQQ